MYSTEQEVVPVLRRDSLQRILVSPAGELENLHLNIYSLDVAASAGNRRMDSLPEPSETVEDEWAAMKIRFRKEGLDWDRLSDQDRILQVGEDSQ